MKSAHELSANKILNTDPTVAKEGESLSQVKNKMEEEELRAIPVVDEKNRLKGVIGYRDLIRFVQFNPATTNLEKVKHQPPEFEPGDSLVELCDLRVNSGRKMLVHTEDKKLEGVIGDQEFLSALTEVEELEHVNTSRLRSYNLLTVSEDDSLEKARHQMLDNNISRLPVVDGKGEISGIIRSTDILRMMVPVDSPDPGGRSGDRKGSEVKIAGGDEKDEMSDITVDQLMNELVLTSQEHMSGSEAAEKMSGKELSEIVFLDGKYPESILTSKDLVDHLADLKESGTILVSITGLEVPEEKAVVHNKIKNKLHGSLGRKLRNPEELTLRVKKAEKDGKKHRYEIELKLHSEYGITNIEEDGWDMMEVVDEGLNELDRVIRDKHDKRTDHHRNR